MDRPPLRLDSRAPGDVLRGDYRHRLCRLRRARRRDCRRRGRSRRPARQHQCHPPPRQRGHQDRMGPHEIPGRYAGADRSREGGHRQAGCAVRGGREGSGRGGGAPRRGQAVRGCRCFDGGGGCAGPAGGVRMGRSVEAGGPASASECRGGPRHPDGAPRDLSAAARRDRGGLRARPRRGAPRPQGKVALRRRPQPRRNARTDRLAGGNAAAAAGARTGVDIWETRSGPRCWWSWTG